MEENLNTVVTEETTPQVPDENNATEVTPEADGQATTPEQQPEEGTENQNSDNNELMEQESTDGADQAPFLMVRYNHESKGLSQAEAQTFAQKGMQAEAIMSDLRYLAANEGAKSVKDFIENLKTAAENARRENIRSQLVDEGNEDLLNALFNAESEKIKSAIGVMTEDENKAFASEFENENTRIADEFIALKAEFPEIKEFKDVSPAVLQIAQKNKISLLDAQLRFQHAENKKIKQAEMSAAAAAESSTGSMNSQDNDASSPVLDAMKKGIWQ